MCAELRHDLVGASPQQDAGRVDRGCLVTTELLIVIMSIVALQLAALAGGGLGLAIMRLLGHKPPTLSGDASDTVH